MLRSLERYVDLYNRLGIKTVILNGILWREYQRMVIPVGPAMFNYSLSKEEAGYLLSRFPRAIMVRCTFDFDTREYTDWYSVICDKFLDLSQLPSQNRSEIKRGLKNCIVKMVDADFIAYNGYETYISAFERYKVAKPADEKRFIQSTLATRGFEDIVHYWGVFYENKLIAYAVNYIYDDIEVNYSTIKFHPEFLKLYSSYALIYTMNKYYLYEKRFKYVNDGFRNILHQTNIQDYLIRKFHFRKAFSRLRIFYRPSISWLIAITFPLRKFLGKIDSKLEALYKLEEIRRQS